MLPNRDACLDISSRPTLIIDVIRATLYSQKALEINDLAICSN